MVHRKSQKSSTKLLGGNIPSEFEDKKCVAWEFSTQTVARISEKVVSNGALSLLNVGGKSTVEVYQDFMNTSSYGTLRTHTRTGSKVLARDYGRERARNLAFYRELGGLRDYEKTRRKMRFSPLCCALLVGASPMVLSGAINNGTITGNHTTDINVNNAFNPKSVVNEGTLSAQFRATATSPVTFTNTQQGLLTQGGVIRNPSGILTIINQGMINPTLTQNNRAINGVNGNVTVINEATGTINGGVFLYTGGQLNVDINNAGTILGTGTLTGNESIFPNTSVNVEGRDIIHTGGGTLSVANTGYIEAITQANFQQRTGGSGTITSNTGTIGTVMNLHSKAMSINSSGVIETVLNASNASFSLSNEAQGNIRTITNRGSQATIANNGGSITGVTNDGGTATIVNATGSINSILNTSNATLNLGTNGGNIGALDNQGTINSHFVNTGTINSFILGSSGTLLGSLENQDSGTIINGSISLDRIRDGVDNSGILGGTLSNSATSTSNLVNRGTLDNVNNSGTLDLTNTGNIATINSSGQAGVLRLTSAAGTIDTIANDAGSATFHNSAAVNTLKNTAGTVTITNLTNARISTLLNENLGTISFDATNQGIIGDLINNEGTINSDFINTGTVTNFVNKGSLLGTLENQGDGTITNIEISGAGSIRDGINNAGSITGILSNSSSGLNIVNTGFIGVIKNDATATLDNTGTVTSVSNLGTSSVLTLNPAGTIGTISNDGKIFGDITSPAKLSNTGTITGTVSANSNLDIVNSGVITGVVRALGSSSINVRNDRADIYSSIGGVENEGTGRIMIEGLTKIKNPKADAQGIYDIRNEGGHVEIANLYVDLEPYVQSYEQHQNFSAAYDSRISLGGVGMDRIDIDHVTVKLQRPELLETFLKEVVNVSQFINGAYGDADRDPHDCTGNDAQNCTITDSGKIYNGKTPLIKGLQDNVGNQKFITILGDKAFTLELSDQYGNFGVVATPQSSPAATVTKTFTSSMKSSATFVDNIVSSSIEDLKHYFESPGNDNKQEKNRVYYRYDKDELYASLASDLVSQSVLKEKSLYLGNAAVYILPYFSFQSVDLDSGDKAKGHTKGLIVGYTGSTENNTFYSVYGGYQSTNMESRDYDTDFKTLYTGFKVSDSLTYLKDNVELFANYDGKIARTRNSIRNNEVSTNSANPKSFSWSLGADLGVNFFVGENTFTPQIGLGYEGGRINSYTLVEKYDKTKINTYHTRARIAWAREWGAHLETVLEAGMRYYFNPEVEFGYELAGTHVEGKDKFAKASGFIGTDFIIPLSQRFYFKFSYSGVFSDDVRGHTGLAKFNYSF